MQYRVSHTTTYQYAEPVSVCHNELHLTPRDRPGQSLLRSQLLVEPAPSTLQRDLDYFGNAVTFLTLQEPHVELKIIAMSHVELTAPAGKLPEAPAWEVVVKRLRSERTADGLAAFELSLDSPLVRTDADVQGFAARSFPPGRPLLDGVRDLVHRIHTDFVYDPGATCVSTPIADVLRERRGVCQDFAHLAIGCLRAVGLAARYVSGYIETVPPPGRERLLGADASHAWLAVSVPEHGWVDFDPTNDVVPDGSHVTLAWGRDYGDVPPVKGVVLGGGEHTVEVAVDVLPLASLER
jgi:transglutaminase-like putative cysteine protease